MDSIKKIAVLGAGKMGSGIALFFAMKGYDVKVIYVYDDKERGTGIKSINENLAILSKNEIITDAEIPAILSRIQFVDAIEEAVDSDIVFECVIEKLEVKQDFFAKMDALMPDHVILASNTSAISITEIAAKAQNRSRILGTHFWDPPFIIPLVEVIKTEQVSEEAVKRTYDLLETSGKAAVLVQKDVPGFLANRMQHALFREALSIIENGIASPEDVDKSIKYGFGMRLGISAPVEVMDRGGLDLTYNIHNYLFPHIEDSKQPLKILTDKIEEGKLGFKSGEGLLKWSEEEIKESNQNLLDGLIKVASALGRL